MTTSSDINSATSMKSTHEATGYTVDFNRDLCFLLGLPFDVIDLDTAVARIRAAAASRTRLFISTPNTNFVVAARRDQAFRDSVFHSDMSLMDGKPMVWAARLLGIPVPERVSGADVFEALRRPGSDPMSVYLFGGQTGVAARAAANINASQGPLKCVGFNEAGFGSVEDMSDDATIDRINASGADFLVVSLGAAKGQAWIEHNLPRLQVPVVSHLGAVVGFVAGSLKRAPPWMRRSGLEWLWRVKEEPHLWKRYVSDGLVFLRLLAFDVIPGALRRLISDQRPKHDQQICRISESESGMTMTLSGALGSDELQPLKRLCRQSACESRQLTIDLSGVTDLDNFCLAVLMQLQAHRRHCGLTTTYIAAVFGKKRGRLAYIDP
jgi:N-acetylglucosaminyldiphosphoundecaprenol N-acetyl-beta-D-mannosaminyltransferase